MQSFSVGSIVRCRNREWVLMPSGSADLYILRPLAGFTDEIVVINKKLSEIIGYDFPEERIRPSTFPPPNLDDVSDRASAYLLWQAARLTLREGATPFRSLGRISVRPRVYQFVPLLMALRLDPVRLFIADDVGVGKTIEALLIAREMFDRGEIRRFCILCPPYLCDQWQKELIEKFNMDSVVIRSGTISRLERYIPKGRSIYEHYPIQVVSIDFAKTEHNRHQFLQFCPEMVIVDEVHGAAEVHTRTQQERHALLKELASNENRHLILLTATPHSGIEEAFRSLLGLINPEFKEWIISDLNEEQRISLARHFVQRTRKDIEHDWEGEYCFPLRETSDETYALSESYRKLFDRTYEFCSEIVRSGEKLEEQKRRIRYWGALALLRCIMSSPSAALTTLSLKEERIAPEDVEEDFRGSVFESSEDRTDDEPPATPVEKIKATLSDIDRHRLRELRRLADQLNTTHEDTKLKRSIEIVKNLLREKFNPILWCRYIATAEYVAEAISKELPEEVQVVVITGRMGDDERKTKIEEIDSEYPRVLVATDCLSEGINLQDKFTAVIHYDLPWNPNRLEQREGRVDRYGQTSKIVKAIRFFGRDNPVDGVVIDVLLNKAREIHRSLGTYVPVPEESESVTEAVLNALFLRGRREPSGQLSFDFRIPQVTEFHKKWERDTERERINRTRFAQRALKPEEVQKELEATDSVLGDPSAVKEFVLTASQRVGLTIKPDKTPNIFQVNISPHALLTVPELIRFSLPSIKTGRWLISFSSPTPEGAEYLGRNHRFVATLARFLMEEALTKHDRAIISRCGAIRTSSVNRLTTLLLLRVRYLIEFPTKSPLLSEEVLVLGYINAMNGKVHWLEERESLKLLAEAKADANLPMAEKKELIKDALDIWPHLEKDINLKLQNRAKSLEESHKRIRRAVSLRVRELTVKPQLSPDLLGILVLQPLIQV